MKFSIKLLIYVLLNFNYSKPTSVGLFSGGLYREGVFRFKNGFLNAAGLIHGGAYYRNFTVYIVILIN